MIALFTDFNLNDPYVGQMHAAIAREAPEVPIVDLFHNAPSFDIRAAAYLLPAYTQYFPRGTIFVCVVDPGVGSERRPVMLQADGNWYVGPDNGLFHMVERRAQESCCHVITWKPERMSRSFHGRDLFAPVGARLARGRSVATEPSELTPPDADWPDELPEVLYIDHFGNAITGIRASNLADDTVIMAGDRELRKKETFSDVPVGEAFWYENANGLAEVAVNQGRVDETLGLTLGDAVMILE